MERIGNWLGHLQITPYGVPDPTTGKPLKGETRFHASGHAAPGAQLELIETINPKTLVPVHAQNPEFSVEQCSKQREVHRPQAAVPFPV